MPKQKYARVVAAALNETQSKFKLCEELVAALPLRGKRCGQKYVAGGRFNVRQELEVIRQKIIDAGGEPKSVETLLDYRKVGLWIDKDESGKFLWVEGASYTAHKEACYSGIDPVEWKKDPTIFNQTKVRVGAGNYNAAIEAEIERRLAEARAEEEARQAIARDVANQTARSRREAMRLYKEAVTTRQTLEVVHDASGPADANLAHWATCTIQLIDHNMARGFKPSDETLQVLRDLNDRLKEIV